MKLIALHVPGGYNIEPVSGMPSGGFNTVQNIAQSLVTIAFMLGVIAAILFIIYGGISWITSGGEKEKVAEAQKKITYALIGLIIIFLSYFIIKFVGDLFGVKLLSFTK